MNQTYLSVHHVDNDNVRVRVYGPGLSLHFGDCEVTLFPTNSGKDDTMDLRLHTTLCVKLIQELQRIRVQNTEALANAEGP